MATPEDTVLLFDGCTSLDVPPERVLREAEKEDLKQVIVIGDTGEDFYLASSMGSSADVLWLLEQAKHRLIRGDYDDNSNEDEYEI